VSAVLAMLPSPRGEFTVVLGGTGESLTAAEQFPDLGSLFDIFYQMTENEGLGRREAVRKLAARFRVSSKELYSALEKAKPPAE
jgi:hypothetical protein